MTLILYSNELPHPGAKAGKPNGQLPVQLSDNPLKERS